MSKEPVYQHDPGMRPDSEFEPGRLHHLVPGTAGRQLDFRRTPVSIQEIRLETGMFLLRIEDFEDQGALWEIPFEEVSHYQFLPGTRASEGRVGIFEATISRLNNFFTIPVDAQVKKRTLKRLNTCKEETSHWLRVNSKFLKEGLELPSPETREGEPMLWHDLQQFMEDKELGAMEAAFASQFVSNPYSGEMIKGHRIVLAEMGLVEYCGKTIRDPKLFQDSWSREKRKDHILSRLTFVSATFDKAVAQARFESAGGSADRTLDRQEVPVEHIFMTYHETEAMNRQYKETEAVVLFAGESLSF